jgi:hypothetical protein
MQKFSRIAAVAALFLLMPAGALLAQGTPTAATPDTGAGATPAPAPAPAPAAAPAATPPATTAPAATATAPATSTPTTAAPAATTTTKPAGTKKKKSARMTRQQEIDRSIDSGTVPSRYRKSVPKEYQQYIPFAK